MGISNWALDYVRTDPTSTASTKLPGVGKVKREGLVIQLLRESTEVDLQVNCVVDFNRESKDPWRLTIRLSVQA